MIINKSFFWFLKGMETCFIGNKDYESLINRRQTLKFSNDIRKQKLKDINWKNVQETVKIAGYPNVVSAFIYKGNQILMLLCKINGKYIFEFPGGYIDPPGFGRSKDINIIETPNNALIGELREELNISGILRLNNLFSAPKLMHSKQYLNILCYFIKYDDITITDAGKEYDLNSYLYKQAVIDHDPINDNLINMFYIPCMANREDIHGFVWIDIDNVKRLCHKDLLHRNISSDYEKYYYLYLKHKLHIKA